MESSTGGGMLANRGTKWNCQRSVYLQQLAPKIRENSQYRVLELAEEGSQDLVSQREAAEVPGAQRSFVVGE